MGRCQTALRPDSHKSNHSRTGQAVLHIRHPRNRPLRPGSKLQKQHRPEHIGCIWSTEKPYHTLYHPQGDGMVERFNRSLLQLLRTYVEKQEDWEHTCHWHCMRTRPLHTPPLACPHFNWCIKGTHSQIPWPPPEGIKPHPTRQYCGKDGWATGPGGGSHCGVCTQAESGRRQAFCRAAIRARGPGVAVGTHSRQVGSAMGGELESKEGEITSHCGDFWWRSHKSGAHQPSSYTSSQLPARNRT